MSENKPLLTEIPDQPAESKSKKTRWGLILSSLLVVGALVGGVFWGMNIVDPTKSDEYLSLADANSTLSGERDKIKEDFEELDAGISDREDALVKRSDALDVQSANLDTRDQELTEAEEAVAAREKAVGKIEAEQLENSVESGVWTVGSDIKAGMYRTKESVGSDCYWAVLQTGTNGSDIIDNGIPGGGRPTVTVKKGQDFESQRCGTWVKQ